LKKRKIISVILAAVLVTAVFVGCSKSRITNSSTNSTRTAYTTIQMATKPMTEQYILGNMMKQLIEQETDLKVEITAGVGGGTANIHPAMEKGDLDFYPEYTGTGWNIVLKEKGIYNETMFEQLQAGYHHMNMTWTGLIGFNNTYGIVVRREIAEQYDLKTITDLTSVSDQLVFGGNYDFFERDDGFKALGETYSLNFKDTVELDIGLKYDAIKQKQFDVMNAFTTDGQLSISDVVVLEDDKGLYPSYVCGFVVRNEILDKHPELQKVFDKVQNLINDAEMANMNYQVEGQGKTPEEVAIEYLQQKGLLN